MPKRKPLEFKGKSRKQREKDRQEFEDRIRADAENYRRIQRAKKSQKPS